jgi:hypothetical protein
MSDTKTYLCRTRVDHDGVVYGDKPDNMAIDLTPEQAAPLLARKAIKPDMGLERMTKSQLVAHAEAKYEISLDPDMAKDALIAHVEDAAADADRA